MTEQSTVVARVFPCTFPTGAFNVTVYPNGVVNVLRYRPWTPLPVMVPDYGTNIFELSARPGFAIGWGQFPDGAEVIYLYDRDDNNFGYAINLDAPDCSEWGYSPFGEAA